MRLDPDSHIQLVSSMLLDDCPSLTRKQDEPLLRVPLELLKNNLKIAQQHCDKTAKKVNELVGRGAKIYVEAGDDEVAEADAALVSNIDQALNNLYALQKKLTTLNESNQTLHKKTKARITHLAELHKIPSLADVKYEEWSRVRLDRLLVDNMLRQGFFESAKQLAEEKGITDLVDIEVFEAVGRIERSLKVDKRVDLALAWCAENRSNLKKLQQDVSQRMLANEDMSIDEFSAGKPGIRATSPAIH